MMMSAKARRKFIGGEECLVCYVVSGWLDWEEKKEVWRKERENIFRCVPKG